MVEEDDVLVLTEKDSTLEEDMDTRYEKEVPRPVMYLLLFFVAPAMSKITALTGSPVVRLIQHANVSPVYKGTIVKDGNFTY